MHDIPIVIDLFSDLLCHLQKCSVLFLLDPIMQSISPVLKWPNVAANLLGKCYAANSCIVWLYYERQCLVVNIVHFFTYFLVLPYR